MAKPKTYEEAIENLEVSKKKLSEQKAELREFKKENKIRKGKPVEDEKVKTQLEKKEGAVETAREAFEAAKLNAKELKPRKARATKYEYPEGMTEKEKKKYRTKMRREAAKAEKGESEEGEEKKPAKKTVKKKPVKKTEEDTED